VAAAKSCAADATASLEAPPGLSKAERTEWFTKNRPQPVAKPKQQQKKTGSDSAPVSADSFFLEASDGAATFSAAAASYPAAKPKATGKPSTGNLAGKLQADDAKAVRTAAKKSLVKREEAFRKITWLAHLPQYALHAESDKQVSCVLRCCPAQRIGVTAATGCATSFRPCRRWWRAGRCRSALRCLAVPKPCT
jgi:hypothetical protein